MKTFLSVCQSLLFFFCIGLLSSLMSQYGQVEPKDTPIEDILWMLYCGLIISGTVFYLLLKSFKK